MAHQWTHPQHVDGGCNGREKRDGEESPEVMEMGRGKTPVREVESQATREKKTSMMKKRMKAE